MLALLIAAGALPTALCRDAQARKARRPKPSVTCPPVPSTDVDAPTPLASKTVSGCGPGKRVSYYYKTITLGRAAGTPVAAGPAAANAGDAAASTNMDAPTPFVGPTIHGTGTNQASSYYYSLTVGPGEVTLTADGKNRPAASASALGLTLQETRARPLCTVSIGNTTRDARKVATCAIPSPQQAILRVDLSAETIDWRAKVEGAVSTP